MNNDVMFKLFMVMGMSIIVDRLTGGDVPKEDVDEFHHMLGGISANLAMETYGKIHANVTDDPHKKAQWLINVVFSFGKRSDFVTAKDAHVHVMVSLETLANVAGE